MINKLDKSLIKALAIENQEIEAIVYVENISKAKKYLRKDNIKIVSIFPFLKSILVVAKSQQFNSILKYKFVKYISSQAKVFALMNVSKKILKIDHEFSGKGVTIAYIDTGIQPHLDFTLQEQRIIKFIDLVNYNLLPYDDNGHGTFVSGVGSGNGLVSNKKYSGIAPKSNIISIKALDENGEASAGRILEAFQWIYDNYNKYNIKVVCMSFGSEPLGENDPIKLGAEALWNKGILVVTASGNSGPEYQTIKSPGISPRVITVGGFNDNRLDDETFIPNYFEIADFSSRGPALKHYKPDVVAPAVNITSCSINDFYTQLSGTSVATPMIAGICALIYEMQPNLKPDQIKKIIKQSTSAITFNLNKEGFGYPNFEKIKEIVKNNIKIY